MQSSAQGLPRTTAIAHRYASSGRVLVRFTALRRQNDCESFEAVHFSGIGVNAEYDSE